MSQIKQVKDATDIIEIIGERLELTRSGASFKANCPFHSEKSPSFFVNEMMQRYKCFGCGESGDVINFLEKYEGMTFVEALEYLADRSGIKLEKFTKTKTDLDRDKILEALDLARQYYSFLLLEHESGQPARVYLENRGVSAESIKLFGLGFSLDKWDGLIDYLHHKKNFSLEILNRAGLIVSREGRVYDRFRGRLMFPLKNHRGQVVGFSGRILNPDAKEAKYINSPETELYHKSEMLYGFSELYQEIRKKKELIITEGEFDVISSAQIHVNNVVAIKGSVLTKEHVKLIGRVAGKIILALDQDSAGVEATKRAIGIAEDSSLEIRVVNLNVLPPDKREKLKDPDDIARAEPKLWREAVKTSISVYEFLIQAATKKNDPELPEGKREIIIELAPIFAQIKHPVERDFYVKKLAIILGVKKDLVDEDLEKTARSLKMGKSPRSPRVKNDSQIKKKPLGNLEKLERYMIFLLLNLPQDQIREKARQIKNIGLRSSEISLFLDKLIEVGPKQVFSDLAGDINEYISEIYLSPKYLNYVTDLKIEEEFSSVIRKFYMALIKDRVRQITLELDKLEKQAYLSPADEELQNKLLREIVELNRKKL